VTSSENPESRDADKTAVITKPAMQGGADQGSKAKGADQAAPSNGAGKTAAPKAADKAEPSKVPDGATVEISKSTAKAASTAKSTPAPAPAAPTAPAPAPAPAAPVVKAPEQSPAEPTVKVQKPVPPPKVDSPTKVDSSPKADVPPKAPTADRPEGLDLVAAAPPPWQRVTSDAQYGKAQTVGYPTSDDVTPVESVPVEQPAYPAQDPDTVAVARPVVAGSAASGNRQSVNLGTSSARPSAAAPSARRPGRGPRRASLQVKRVDPWSVLKLALVLSVALFFVWLVAIGVLYGVLNGMGVWDKINNTAQDLLSGSEQAGDPLISAGRVFGVAAIIGAVNIVLFTALATVSAFVYNVSADLAGGLELTLSERE
jgi:transmembrane protein DUF3566